MHTLIYALAFASALSAIFAFRYGPSRRVLVIYFVGFASLEWAAHSFLLPEGAIPIEAAWVLFGIAAIFVPLVYARHRIESAEASRASDTAVEAFSPTDPD